MSVYVAPPGSVDAGFAGVHRRRSLGGRLATILLTLTVSLAVAVAVAAALGYRPQVVLTGSMQPAIAPNDVVIAKSIPAAEMRVGDIVSFGAPHAEHITMTHRVRSVARRPDGTLAVQTRGDANTVSERWTVHPSASVGRIDATLPGLGFLTGWARDPVQRTLVFGLAGLVLLVGGLRWVWRS